MTLLALLKRGVSDTHLSVVLRRQSVGVVPSPARNDPFELGRQLPVQAEERGVVSAGAGKIPHLGEQGPAIHVGLGELGLELEGAVVVFQRLLTVGLALHAQAEGEVVVGLGEPLVGGQRLLELLLGGLIALVDHQLHAVVVRGDCALADTPRPIANRAPPTTRARLMATAAGRRPTGRARAAPALSRGAGCRPRWSARSRVQRRSPPSSRRPRARPPAWHP